jgi:hypothetical protein
MGSQGALDCVQAQACNQAQPAMVRPFVALGSAVELCGSTCMFYGPNAVRCRS